jgi:uncharacterized protein (DUF2236 family)
VIEAVHPHAADEAPPFEATPWPFTDESAIRRVNSEAVLLLGGGRALLMQLAHPQVAAGVAAHSHYRCDRIGRLLRTLRPMYAIAFGTPGQGLAAAWRVNALHEHVRGEGYHATDPALLAWVLATLIDSALTVHQRFIGPLAPEEATRYYGDMLEVGRLLRVPEGALPSDLLGFRHYRIHMVQTLEVSHTAREMAGELFEPLPGSGPLLPLAGEITAGLLPARLRREYGLAWDPVRASALAVAASTSRAVLPYLPRPLRRTPRFLMPATGIREPRAT